VTVRDGRAVLIVGATGSGKTLYARQALAGAPRLLVWDVEHVLHAQMACAPLRGRRALVAAARGAATRPARLAYLPSQATAEEFDFFAAVAFAWVSEAPGAVLAEELADVTRPGKAPPAWGKLLRRGRARGAEVYAITQRVTECDTTVSGLAAEVVCFRLDRPGDRARMAEFMDCPPEEIGALGRFEYLHRDRRRARLTRRKLTPPPRR
jgi:hypothetical protein